jgi:hypothetical protein
MVGGGSGLADSYSAGVRFDTRLSCSREQGVRFVAEPACPGRRGGYHNQLSTGTQICGNYPLGVLAGQRPGEDVRQLAHLSGSPDDITQIPAIIGIQQISESLRGHS